MQQLKDKLSGYTIDPDFYKLAIEALAQQEDEVVEKDQAQTTARDKAIEKKKQAITNLRRMKYNGEANDDSWYFAEMQTLEDELKNLEDKRNAAEYKARDWRATADEVFTFARYAKEDFDTDDLEKKRTVVVKLGEKLTILDRTIQFTPNKYFVPIEKMNNTQRQLTNMVRTENNDAQKSKNTPVGVLAIPDESTSTLDLNSSWLPIPVLNPVTGVWGQKIDNLRHYEEGYHSNNRRES